MNIRFLARIPLAAALAAACLPASAQTAAAPPPPQAGAREFLWEVSSLTNKVYLYGIVHSGKASFYPLPASVEKAFADSQVLAVEADITNAEAIAKESASMTYVPPDCSESTNATSDAVLGPALLVVITYTSVSPATGLAGLANVFVTDRFAVAPTDVLVAERLFAVLGSLADELTRATFPYVPSSGATTRTVSARDAPR